MARGLIYKPNFTARYEDHRDKDDIAGGQMRKWDALEENLQAAKNRVNPEIRKSFSSLDHPIF